MAFSHDFLDEIRSRLALADVIGRHVKLVRRGREYVGLCPFHKEKTPSFTINEDKGFFHCFGCGSHGDVIGFAMRFDNLSFPEAVERMAEQAGLPVPVSSPEERTRAAERKTLHAALEAACRWFERQLQTGAGRVGLEYLKGRGLEDDTIARFRLGYGPNSRGALKAALGAEGLSEQQLLESGLLVKPDDGAESYDRFRGRVVFPIMEARGRVVGFGARTLGDGQPKYLNSPESALFHKGRLLYGLPQAAAAARESREIAVAEGYMDVLALSQAGVQAAVAPLGTALSEAQVELLWRLAPEPVLCFDGDAAGQTAAYRAAERVLPLLRAGLSLRFALLPSGEDPDSLIRGAGAGAMREVLGRARHLTEVLWDMAHLDRPGDTPERRAEIRQRIMGWVDRIGDRSVHRYYRDEMEARLEAALSRRRPPFRRREAPRPGPRAHGNVAALELRVRQGFLAAMVNHPPLLDDFAEALGSHPLPPAELDDLRQELIKTAGAGLDSETLQSHLKQRGYEGVLGKVLSREVYEAVPFAHPKRPLAEVRAEWLKVWNLLRQRDARSELEQDEAAFGQDMTPERWARLAAKKTEIEAAEARELEDLAEDAGLE